MKRVPEITAPRLGRAARKLLSGTGLRQTDLTAAAMQILEESTYGDDRLGGLSDEERQSFRKERAAAHLTDQMEFLAEVRDAILESVGVKTA